MANASKPRPDQFPTLCSYLVARHNWLRRHGGSFLGTLAIAVFFGLLTGSTTALFGLVAFAIVCTAIARSRP
jgi:hypothetical protein